MTDHYVVVNDEEQYSIWAADRPVPAGWHPVGEPRPEQDCLEWIRGTGPTSARAVPGPDG